MFDYLNECLFLFGKKNRTNNTYKRARALQKQGAAYIFNLLCKEWCARFRWDYDPEDGAKTIATQLIEKTILFNTACGFAKYKQTRGSYSEETWRNFIPTGMDNLSFYGLPNRCTLTDYSGRISGQYIPAHEEEPDGIANCVLIFDNVDNWTPLYTIFYYAEKLTQINTSINACISNILGTSLISCTQEQAKEIERQRQAAGIGVPYLIFYDDTDVRPPRPEMLSTPGASEELKVLYEAFDKTHHDFLQSIGVRVDNKMDKKAGITPMEIIENRMNVDLILNESLRARQKGIELAERIGLTGLSVSLDNFENLVGDYDKNGNRIGIEETETGEKEEEKEKKEEEDGGDDVE